MLSKYQTAAANSSIRTEPSMIRADPNWIGWPMASRNGALSCRSPLRIDSEREYQVLRAVKIDSVPSVTMKGGMRNRVTKRPFTQPHRVPTTSPATKPISTGKPRMTERRPITIEASTMTMPTERSIPAVRMISVWAIPRMPMIVTCSRIVERFEPVVKRAQLTDAPRATPSSSTKNGTTVG